MKILDFLGTNGLDYSSVEVIRARFPALYSFGADRVSARVDDLKGKLPSSVANTLDGLIAQGKGVQQTVTGISNAYSEIISQMKSGTGVGGIFDVIKDPIGTVNRVKTLVNTGIGKVQEFNLPKETVETMSSTVTDFIKGAGKMQIGPKMAGLASMVYASFKVDTTGNQLSQWLQYLKDLQAYIKYSTSFNPAFDDGRIILQIAAMNDTILGGKGEGWRYPFSKKNRVPALSGPDLQVWMTRMDAPLLTTGVALAEAFNQMGSSLSPIIRGDMNHWLAFSLSFAHNESGFNKGAKNLSQGGYDQKLQGGNYKRKGAFGAFQIRWSNVVRLKKRFPEAFDGLTAEDFDNSLKVQAKVFAYLLDANVRQMSKNYFMNGPNNSTVWVSDEARRQLATIATNYGFYGQSPSGILSTLCSLSLTVGPYVVSDNMQNPAAFVVKWAQTKENFTPETYHGRAANTTLYKMLLAGGLTLGGLANYVQRSEV